MFRAHTSERNLTNYLLYIDLFWVLNKNSLSMETFKEQFFHMWQVGDLVDNLSGFWPTLLELFIRQGYTNCPFFMGLCAPTFSPKGKEQEIYFIFTPCETILLLITPEQCHCFCFSIWRWVDLNSNSCVPWGLLNFLIILKWFWTKVDCRVLDK